MDVAERHRGLRAAYKEAEDAIHSLGIQGEGVDILAINELRYAGYHLLKSLTAAEDSERDEELRRAESHCERSLYEAHDAAIFFRLDLYQKFTEDYSTVVVSEVVENFVEIVKTMKRAKRLLEEARAATTDRSQYYSNIREIYGEIVDASETMEAARDELNKRLVEAQGESQRSWRQPMATVVAAVVGAVLSGTLITLGAFLVRTFGSDAPGP